MAISNPYQAYQQNSVTTASPGELTLMLYNGCLKFIQLSIKAVEDNNLEAKHMNLVKAQNIITELNMTLNLDYPVAKNMRRLYDYMNRRLIEANIKNDKVIMNEVADLVMDFRDTWKQVIQLNRQKQFAQAGQA